MYRLAARGRKYHNFSRLAIFPVWNADFVQIEN
jgi:hypothetical protein